MALLVTKWFGVFLCDEKSDRVIDSILMPKDSEKTAEKLALVQRGSILQEERDLASKAGKISVSERRQSELGRPEMYDSSFVKPEKYGFTPEMMHEVMIRLGKLRTSEPVPRDRNLVQAIRYLDSLYETSNLIDERLHEWYGMHFPELADLASDRKYSDLIARHGEREGVLEELGLDLQSMGADFESADMDAVRALAQNLSDIYDERERTDEYIESIVKITCPNMCALLGGALAARLISLAGGLERLSSLPSSTLQLLGAEKAMFRHLRSGKRPPKHGAIYQHPSVHRAPYWQRGKIARSLAGKALTAAKIDHFKGEFRGDVLAEEFDARVEDIRRRYPEAPKKKQGPSSVKKRRRPKNKTR
jgi:nucleolar protein 56